MSKRAGAADDPPAGYRWVSRPWRRNADGTRDYAVFHGQAVFRTLAPVSSRLRSYGIFDLFRRAEGSAKTSTLDTPVQALPVSPTQAHG